MYVHVLYVKSSRVNEIQDTKAFPNVMLVGMASEISKKFTYKCLDHLRHNKIKGARSMLAAAIKAQPKQVNLS